MVNLTKLKRPRPILLILLVLILIVGGGVYYFYFYRQKIKPQPPEEVTEVGIEYPQGTVERIEEDKIVIRTDTGLLELLVDKNTIVTFETKSLAEALSGEKATSLEDIKVGDEIAASVKAFSDQTREAFYIEISREE